MPDTECKVRTSENIDGMSLIMPEMIEAYGRQVEGESALPQRAELAMDDLTRLEARLSGGEQPDAIFPEVLATLDTLRSGMLLSEWRVLAPVVAAHPISRFLLQDPFTEWSHRKPRGYSGDASLLDFVYGHQAAAARIEGASPLGRSIYRQTFAAPSCAAVRERREIIARHVDAAAAAHPGEVDVMAIAAGHLREAELSSALAEGSVRRWVALDQDPESIEEIDKVGNAAVEAMPGSVRDVIGRPQKFGKFDMVYSAGLYDYLEHKVAVRMTAKCVEMLKPGGSYLFANFATGIIEAAYMQSFMRWELIYRTVEDMRRIVEESAGEGCSCEIFSGVHGAIHYARITRGG